MKKIVLAMAAVGALATGCAGSTSSYSTDSGTSSNNFLDAETLAADVWTSLQEAMDNNGMSDTVSEVSCLATSVDRQFICHAETIGGEQANTTVSVSEDGMSWASHG